MVLHSLVWEWIMIQDRFSPSLQGVAPPYAYYPYIISRFKVEDDIIQKFVHPFIRVSNYMKGAYHYFSLRE